ncbi:MAG TPA: hypothetical protein VGN24_08725 [Rhodanobacter sp.]|jgi:hypothetical protein|nr:hypothetical protein [Rhodanobacter sp.]
MTSGSCEAVAQGNRGGTVGQGGSPSGLLLRCSSIARDVVAPVIPGWSKRVPHHIEQRPIEVAERKLDMLACRLNRSRPTAEVLVHVAAERLSP